jgi:chemotaxis protein histidine kinase CheA
MADKAISDLTQATQITGEDLFVLQQSGEAKKLKGSQVVQYAKDSVAAEVQGVKKYADSAKASADAAAASATKAAGAAQGIDDKVAAADASAKAAASSAVAAAESATGVDEKVQAAKTAATNAAKSETAAKAAQTAAANAQKAAESAQTGAQSAKTAAESAQEAAESAKDAAAGSSTAAGQKATQAAQSAEDAASAKSAAETAKTDAQAARDAIVNMIVEAVTLETGKPATVSKSLVDNVYKLAFGLPRGETGAPGPKGAPGNGISGIALKSGTHAPGTSDVYTITLTDGTTFDFEVYNGANGQGAGDMLASVYDPRGKRTDVYKYVDDAIGKIPTPDVSVQIKAHNEDKTAHPDIRAKIPTKTSQLTNDSGYLTQHQDISGKLDKTGDGSNVTVAFTAATARANIATGEKLSVLFGKIAKWFSDLGSLAFKSTVAKSDLAVDVQTSLGKADSALQSVSKSDVGLSNVANERQYSPDNPPPYPVTSVNGKTGAVNVPSVNVPSTTSLLKGNGSGGIVAATRGSDYIASGNIVKQTLVASETTPTENYAINWLYG